MAWVAGVGPNGPEPRRAEQRCRPEQAVPEVGPDLHDGDRVRGRVSVRAKLREDLASVRGTLATIGNRHAADPSSPADRISVSNETTSAELREIVGVSQ